MKIKTKRVTCELGSTCYRSKLTAATRFVEGLTAVSMGQVQSKDVPLPDD